MFWVRIQILKHGYKRIFQDKVNYTEIDCFKDLLKMYFISTQSGIIKFKCTDMYYFMSDALKLTHMKVEIHLRL